jgi:hypothetical protein
MSGGILKLQPPNVKANPLGRRRYYLDKERDFSYFGHGAQLYAILKSAPFTSLQNHFLKGLIITIGK